jgi:hypothetical protein
MMEKVMKPVWANEGHTAINVMVFSEEYGLIPFTATPDDPMDYGREIYDACINGEHGEIAEYVPPEIDYVAEAERMKAQLMAAAEAAITPLKRAVKYGMATDAEKQLLEEWEIYTVMLSRVDTSLAPDNEWPPVPA